MRSIRLTLVCVSLAVAFLAGCEPTRRATPQEMVRELGAETLASDAERTLQRCVRPDKEAARTIATEFRVGSIRKLEPVRVYNHRSNLAVVLESSQGVEKGLYVCAMISS